MHRFYLENINHRDNLIEINDPRIVQQCQKVLRMKPGSRLSVFNEKGNEWALELIEVDRKKLIGNVTECIERKTESPIELHLYQAIPKKPALFEWVIQKATELGVSTIYPLITRRTEGRKLLKFDRLQMIAIEAAEQSGRVRVPIIQHPITFEEVPKKKPVYIAYEFEKGNELSNFLPEIKKSRVAHILVGPEGGFDTNEIMAGKKAEAKSFSLGPRILRTETAGIVVVAQTLI
ncbi:16S rRNA (uracil(1498)-N(3))-methyltransferase [Candidatus Peregrinibacteria bacterium]|nr:MAG: 16S rRNA (uracil(1498)-N(3))-methyltransferase [Candidatus Peregrinibacteria bacterium]